MGQALGREAGPVAADAGRQLRQGFLERATILGGGREPQHQFTDRGVEIDALHVSAGQHAAQQPHAIRGKPRSQQRRAESDPSPSGVDTDREAAGLSG